MVFDKHFFESIDKYMMPHEENRFLSGQQIGPDGRAPLADPIVPISKLGTTFAEKGGNGQGNVLSSMQASIRQGVGQLQLAIQTPTTAQMGGGVSSMGKDMRQAIRETIKATGIDWQGLEMPVSSMSNMSGFDGQKGFDDAKRQRDLQSVRDAILFATEIGAGGGVDVWSQETPRQISSASFKQSTNANDIDKSFIDYEGFDQNKDDVRYLVDDRNGQIIPISASSLGGQGSSTITIPKWVVSEKDGIGPNGKPIKKGMFLDADGNGLQANFDDPNFIVHRKPKFNEESGRFETETLDWNSFQKYSQDLNKQSGKQLSPEEWAWRLQLEGQYAQQKAQTMQYLSEHQMYKQRYDELRKQKEQVLKENPNLSPEELKSIDLQMQSFRSMMNSYQEIASRGEAQADNVWQALQHVKKAEDYALEKTAKSYAELGIFAMEQTKANKNLLRPIHVGPELGWPTAYGGHTDEFIEIIKRSREEMLRQMEHHKDFANLSKDEKKEAVKKHISGMLDTSHLSMWYNHFPRQKNETEEQRLKRFNNWYLEQMDKLGDADVVGSIQIVDSATGDHRHLPVGQGIFPTVDAVKRLQAQGYDGPIVSEGHEEDPMDPGKIQYSLWSAFGASMGTGTGHFMTGGARGNSFGNVYGGFGGAAGYRAPPGYIVGAYVPSNEWKLWSDVPLE